MCPKVYDVSSTALIAEIWNDERHHKGKWAESAHVRQAREKALCDAVALVPFFWRLKTTILNEEIPKRRLLKIQGGKTV